MDLKPGLKKNPLSFKGFESLMPDIAAAEEELRQVVVRARSFQAASKKLNLIRKIYYQMVAVKYQGVPDYDLPTINIPYMTWRDYRNHKRVMVADWSGMSQILDQANASFDEKILHMQMHMKMRCFWGEGRIAAEKLRTAHRLASDLQNMLGLERMTMQMLPDNVRYGDMERRLSPADDKKGSVNE